MLEELELRNSIRVIILFIIVLLIYSLLKQLVYWITFNDKFRALYKVFMIIVLMIALRFI